MKTIKLILLLLIFLSIESKSQTSDLDSLESLHILQKNPVGTEFWLTFMKNYRDEGGEARTNDLMLELFITGDSDANVVVLIDAIGFKREIFVPGGTIQNVKIDSRAQISSFGVIENGLAVKVTSDSPISIYGLNRRYQTTDTYLGFPKEVLGTEYRVVTYFPSIQLMPIFAVVATEDNTVLTITTTADTDRNQKEGEPFIVTLNQGDVYQVRALENKFNPKKADLTGSLIQANKKIAVFSGHQCAYVPIGPPLVIACNHLVEQIPPISSWGKHFYVGRLEKRSEYTFRVVSAFDSTKVFIENKLVKTLNPGEFYEQNSSDNLQVTADKPILVAQFSQGFKNGDLIGDPMMLLISPTQQFLRQYRFATPINGQWDHYINVVAPRSAISSILLNGISVDASLFEPLGLSRYSIAHIQVPFGTHEIRAKEPIGMYSYGFGFGEDSFDAYGTMGGQSFLEYVEGIDSRPPTAEYTATSDQDLIIFRDDRIDDSGIKSIIELQSNGLQVKIGSITQGLAQVPVEIINNDYYQPSSIVLQAVDVADNISYFTLCYFMDKNTGQFIYSLSPNAEGDCDTDPGFELGLYGVMNTNFHSPDFISSGNVNSLGKFDNAVSSSLYAGISVGRKITTDFRISGRLILQQYTGAINSIDSIPESYRDPITSQILSVQQSSLLELKSLFMEINLSADYLFTRNLYGFAGFAVSLPIGDNNSLKRRIDNPPRFTYTNGKSEIETEIDEIGSLTSLNFALMLGGGIQIPLAKRLSGFTELAYKHYLNNLIDDGDWKFSQISLHFGVKYNIANPFTK